MPIIRPVAPHHPRLRGSFLVLERPFYTAHDSLGYVAAPGSHVVRHVVNDQEFVRRMDIGSDGFRAAATAEPRDGELWIFGCSFTFGWPLANDETYAAKLQAGLPDVTVRNFGMNGFGTVHVLTLLSALLQRARPAAVVIGHHALHFMRNAPGDQWLQYLGQQVADRDAFFYLGARLAENGGIAVSKIPLAPGASVGVPAHPVSHQIAVTTRVLEVIRHMTRERGIPLVVLDVTEGPADPVMTAFAETGGQVVRPPDTSDMRCYPFDNHPSPAAHDLYAEALEPVLRQVLS